MIDFSLQLYSFNAFLLTYKIITKMIVPKNPVTADKGISEAVKHLEKISVKIINMAPKTIHKGIERLVFRPTSNLTICGTTKPIHPIVPEKATELAVRKVATIIIKERYKR